jgi:hypothetical protein
MFRTLSIPLAIILSVIPIASFSESTSRVCTLIGCDEGARVELISKLAIPRGEYSMSLEADDVLYACSITIEQEQPYTSCINFKAILITSFSYDPDPYTPQSSKLSATIGVDGYIPGSIDADGNMRSAAEKRLEALPDNFVITLSKDRVPFYENTFQPDYEISYPNGQHCDACVSWYTRVELDASVFD